MFFDSYRNDVDSIAELLKHWIDIICNIYDTERLPV